MRTWRRSRVSPGRRPTRSIPRSCLEQRPGAGCVARRPAADEVGQVVRSERRIARVPAGVCVHSGRGSGDERQRRRHSCGGPGAAREWKSVCMRDPFPASAASAARRSVEGADRCLPAARLQGYAGLFRLSVLFPRRSERFPNEPASEDGRWISQSPAITATAPTTVFGPSSSPRITTDESTPKIGISRANEAAGEGLMRRIPS